MGRGEQNTFYRLAGYLMVVSASVLFGFNGSVSRRLFDDHVTPVTLVELRMLIGGVCLLAVLLTTVASWRRAKERTERERACHQLVRSGS